MLAACSPDSDPPEPPDHPPPPLQLSSTPRSPSKCSPPLHLSSWPSLPFVMVADPPWLLLEESLTWQSLESAPEELVWSFEYVALVLVFHTGVALFSLSSWWSHLVDLPSSLPVPSDPPNSPPLLLLLYVASSMTLSTSGIVTLPSVPSSSSFCQYHNHSGYRIIPLDNDPACFRCNHLSTRILEILGVPFRTGSVLLKITEISVSNLINSSVAATLKIVNCTLGVVAIPIPMASSH